MLFPKAERVVYDHNPLVEVICQFKYPPILRINSEEPVSFQEKIADEFPILTETVGVIPDGVVQTLPSEAIRAIKGASKAYEFSTRDKHWVVSLTREFIALTNSNYIRWEEFYSKFKIPFYALNEVYSPQFFSRIGLRYQNVIHRSQLGLTDMKWTELINPVLTHFFEVVDDESQIEEAIYTTVLDIGDGTKVRIRYGKVRETNSNETCFLIDNDFYTNEEKDFTDGLAVITDFNERNRDLFRWCLTDTLHNAMDPRPV